MFGRGFYEEKALYVYPYLGTPEARETLMENTKNMTDRQFFESLKTDKVETLQHWMGTEDFFIAIGTLKVKKLFLIYLMRQVLMI